MATYAIGDLQGCYDPLRRLLDYISFDPAADRVWFVGDLVNRGPQSLEVLRFVKALGVAATVVLGNHDLHLVMQAAGYGKPGSEDTLEAVLAATDRDELLAWLRAQPLFHVEDNWAMVHAGLLPSWTVAQAQALSDEASAALRADDYREFLANMWGSEPAAWRDDKLAEKWRKVRIVRRVVTGALEIERAQKRIGSSLEAHPIVHVSNAELFEAVLDIDLAEVCITSAATLVNDEGPADAFRLPDVAGVAVVSNLAVGTKCARSWKILTSIGADPEFPDVSPRDAKALREWETMRKAAE